MFSAGVVGAEAAGGGVFGSGAGGGVRVLEEAFALDDFVEGGEEDAEIEPEALAADVAEIQADALAEGEVVAPADLRQAGEPGAHAHALAPGALAEGVHVLRHPWARADEAHVAAQDVEQLRQLIQRGGAQDAPEPSGARFIRQQLAGFRVASVRHGAEFVDIKIATKVANTLLSEDGATDPGNEQQQGDEQQQRRERNEEHKRQRQIQRALETAIIPPRFAYNSCHRFFCCESACVADSHLARQDLSHDYIFLKEMRKSKIINSPFLVICKHMLFG